MNIRNFNLDILFIVAALALVVLAFIVSNRIEGTMYLNAAIVAVLVGLWLKRS